MMVCPKCSGRCVFQFEEQPGGVYTAESVVCLDCGEEYKARIQKKEYFVEEEDFTNNLSACGDGISPEPCKR